MKCNEHGADFCLDRSCTAKRRALVSSPTLSHPHMNDRPHVPTEDERFEQDLRHARRIKASGFFFERDDRATIYIKLEPIRRR